MAKTYHVLSVIYDHQGSPEKKREYEQKAAEFFSFCGDKEMPARYHEQLLRNYAEKGVLDGSIKHLEKMYQSARAANKQETIRDIARKSRKICRILQSSPRHISSPEIIEQVLYFKSITHLNQ